MIGKSIMIKLNRHPEMLLEIIIYSKSFTLNMHYPICVFYGIDIRDNWLDINFILRRRNEFNSSSLFLKALLDNL